MSVAQASRDLGVHQTGLRACVASVSQSPMPLAHFDDRNCQRIPFNNLVKTARSLEAVVVSERAPGRSMKTMRNCTSCRARQTQACARCDSGQY